MDEREKIIEALKSNIDWTYVLYAYKDVLYENNVEHIADALIAANIGDVTEWKERAEKHRVIALPGGRIKQLYSDEEVEQIAKERDELKERAGSEIKSCYKEIAQKRDEIAKLRKQLKRTQNAVKKQKNRAEVRKEVVKECLQILYNRIDCGCLTNAFSRGWNEAISTAFKEISEKYGVSMEDEE